MLAIPTKVESTRTEEEPHRLIHEVYRPVIQELWEVIQPYRKYVQQIQPVIEEVQQIISSSQNPRRQSSNSQLSAITSQMSGSGLYSQGSAQYQKRSGIQIHDKYSEEQIIASPVPQLIQSRERPQKNQSPTLLINDLNKKGQSSISSAQNWKNPLKDKYFRLGGALERLNIEGPKRRGLQIHRKDEMSVPSSQPNSEYYLDYNDYPLNYNLDNNQRTRLYEDVSSDVYDLDYSSVQPIFDEKLSRRSVI